MNPKTLFLSAFFLFASALCLCAQVTYEYAAVTYSYGSTAVVDYYIGVSTGDNFVQTKVKSKFDSKGIFNDISPLVEKVNELAKEGWEVYSTSSMANEPNSFYLTYHLRRKKP